MPTDHPAQRRYPPELKQRAVQMVLELRRQDPADHGILSRVSRQLGVGVESLRTWVKQAEVDGGVRPGTTTQDKTRIAELEKERDAFVQQANSQIIAYNAVIAELQRLIAPPVEANGHVEVLDARRK